MFIWVIEECVSNLEDKIGLRNSFVILNQGNKYKEKNQSFEDKILKNN